mmetsp:Transcript_30877/g.92673  ORF Transcript_30877/g.92673 Transcript_30877/m.92673 type:complete len:453 (-) Transcript_30877:195-1553(-)
MCLSLSTVTGRPTMAAALGGVPGREALVDVNLRELIDSGVFQYPADRYQLGSLKEYVQPASIDLPVSGSIFLVKEKVLPFCRRVADLLSELVLEERSLKGDGAVLLRGQTYLVHFGKISLPAGHSGSLSPKSSIGRIDLMIRGIVDECGLYDTVPGGRAADLWFEITPQSFNVRIKEGLPLTQLMVFRDAADAKPVKMAETPVVFDGYGEPISPRMHDGRLILSLRVPDVHPTAQLPEAPSPGRRPVATTASAYHTPPRSTSKATPDRVAAADAPEAAPEAGGAKAAAVAHVSRESCDLVGYEAVATNEVLDLSKVGEHPAENFFRPVRTSVRGGRLTLEKDRFYILATKEFIAVPLDLSAEMVPFSHLVGELRAHYAGFFDPGFGYGRAGEVCGTIGVLEVRPHETITIYDGQPICMMQYFRNASEPAKPYGFSGNNYAGQQGPKLAKFFV